MSVIYVEPAQKAKEILPLIRSAIESEIVKLQLAFQIANNRLTPYEKKYGVTSDDFIRDMVAEDLEGGDDEYVDWAGEYKLMQRLKDRLQRLQEIKYLD